MWIIATDNKATFLCRYKQGGKLSSTSDINKACHFNSDIEAEAYIMNNLPKNTRSKYIVVKASDILDNEIDGEFEWINLRSAENVESFKHVSEILKRAPAYKKVLEAKKVQVEDSLVDIYHFIEFNNLSTVKAYKVYKKEQELLQLRRRIKEELYCLEQLTRNVDTGHVKIPEYLNSIDRTKDRAYIPKVLVELFENTTGTKTE